MTCLAITAKYWQTLWMHWSVIWASGDLRMNDVEVVSLPMISFVMNWYKVKL